MVPRIVLVGLLVAVVPLLGCGRGRSDTLLDVSRELLFQQEFSAALDKCDQFLESTPANLEALLLRGEINLKWGKVDEALADYTKAIAVAPDNPEGYYCRARLYGYLGDTQTQQADERRARELDVQSRLAYSIEFRPARPFSSRNNSAEPTDETFASDDEYRIANLDPAASDPLVGFEGNNLGAADDPGRPADGDVTNSASTSLDMPTADTPYKRWLAQKKSAEAKLVKDRDLRGVPDAAPTEERNFEVDRDNLEDPGSLEDEDLVEPSPRTTRFGLQFGDPLPGAATGRRDVPTGIPSGSTPSPSRRRFFLQRGGRIGSGNVVPQRSPPTTGIISRHPNQATRDDTAGRMRSPSPLPSSLPGSRLPFGPRRQQSSTNAGVWPPPAGAAFPTTARPGTAPQTPVLPGSTTWPLTKLPSGSTAATPGSTWGVIPPVSTGIRGGNQ